MAQTCLQVFGFKGGWVISLKGEAKNSHSLKFLISWAWRSQFWEVISALETTLAWEVTRPGELPVYQVSFLDFLFI